MPDAMYYYTYGEALDAAAMERAKGKKVSSPEGAKGPLKGQYVIFITSPEELSQARTEGRKKKMAGVSEVAEEEYVGKYEEKVSKEAGRRGGEKGRRRVRQA